MDRLNLDHLKTFADVVELGSFSAAADRLSLTQPAVSLQVRQLERRLGTMLIERVGRKARPTAAGTELLLHATRIDAAVQGSETLPYAQQLEAGKYRVVGKPFTLGYQGIMVRKDDTALRAAVMETLTAMVADGSYGKILATWGLAGNAVEKPLLNAGTQK